MRFSVSTSGWTLPVTFLDTPIVDISRDGKQIAFISGVEGVPHLFLRRIDEFGNTQIEGTQGATNPFFSPDGQWIGFIADGQLKKVSSRGKTVIELCEVPGRNRGAWWGDNGRIVYSPSYQSSLFEISESGGTPVPLTELDAESEERTHRFPQVLPGGDSVLFTIGFIDSPSQYDNAHIAVYSRGDRGRRKS